MEFKHISCRDQFCSLTVRDNLALVVLTICIRLYVSQDIQTSTPFPSLSYSDAYIVVQLTSSCKHLNTT